MSTVTVITPVTDIEKPIAVGVLKIKAKIGELLPAGKVGAGRGNKIEHPIQDFNSHTIAAYRKLAKHKSRLAALFGVSQQAVSLWFDRTNASSCNTSKPDARVKIPAAHKPVIVERVIKLNMARRHLEPYEWGLAFKKLLAERGVRRGKGRQKEKGNDCPFSLSEIAAELGVPERTAKHRLSQADKFESLPKKKRDAIRNRAVLGEINKRCMWYVGDWYRLGRSKKWAQEGLYDDSEEKFGITVGAAKNAVVVGDAIEESRRRDSLSWSHHAEVAPLPPDEQDHWLDLAEENGWSRNELRDAIKSTKDKRYAVTDIIAQRLARRGHSERENLST